MIRTTLLVLACTLLAGCSTVAQLSDCQKARLGLAVASSLLEGEVEADWLARIAKLNAAVDMVCAEPVVGGEGLEPSSP